MTRTTDDRFVTQLLQLSLKSQGLYDGAVDGVYGPVSDAGFVRYVGFNRYADAATLAYRLSAGQLADLAKFLKNWKVNAARYDQVAAKANVPATLVAALHWRESGGDFTTYLQNGDPLGSPTVHVPKGILFTEWEPAAVDAIERETGAFSASGVDEDCRNLPALCVFAEHFNGEGYAERGQSDPYVLAGTVGYTSGKFTADGEFDPADVDGQLGVLVMLRAIVS